MTCRFDDRALALGARLVAQAHQLQRGQNRREWVPQFVAEHGQELVFRSVRGFGVAPGIRELGHIERHNRDAGNLSLIVEQRLIHEMKNASSGALC